MRKEAKTLAVNLVVFSRPAIAILTVLIFFIILSGLVQAVGWNQSHYNITYFVSEDTPYIHNFTTNVTNPEVGMTFKILETEGKKTIWDGIIIDYSDIRDWIYFINLVGSDESSDGLFLFNATYDNQTGNFSIPLFVGVEGSPDTGHIHFQFNITAVNDAPEFQTLTNQSFNRSSLFEYIINITDEEDDTPFSLNITFLSCDNSGFDWSWRNCTDGDYNNISLFNESHYTFNGTQLNISFTPDRNDVGNFTINFTITDSGNTTNPNNASRSEIINFEVLHINDIPYFTFVCNPSQSAETSEDSEFTCYINATDIDELNNLTFSANESWFNFSETSTSSTTISGQYNFSTLVNITATDIAVGNWSINITINDTGSPIGVNSTILYFNISNVDDAVFIESIPDITDAFSSNNETFSVLARDDDISIPDKSVYNETLTFSTNNSNVTIVSAVFLAGTNAYNATLNIDTLSLGSGTHYINISVNDSNGFSQDSTILNITIEPNEGPYWIDGNPTSLTMNENDNFFFNLSLWVNDSDTGQDLNFSFINDTRFDNFDLNEDTGIINFTPEDIDVGFHTMTIYVTDGITSTPEDFEFTVYNLNESVTIYNNQFFGDGTEPNGGITLAVTNVNVTEDTEASFTFLVQDEDYIIPQKSFYRENVTVTLTIEGINMSLFYFSPTSEDSPTTDVAQFDTVEFTPRKADVGTYNVTVNFTDISGNSDSHSFNLTVLSIDHDPEFSEEIENQILSILNETLYLDINATDLEDGGESTNNLTYTIKNITTGGNFFSITPKTGIINFTTNDSIAGLYQYLLTVNDSTNNTATEYFNITIYDYPQILMPLSSYEYNLVENETSELNFSVNHTVQDQLNYTLIINGEIRNSTTGYGNATAFLWDFMPTFLDETTCSGVVNLTLNVSNSKLSNETSWNLTIDHTNYPMSFNNSILGPVQGGSPQILTLSNYFSDLDASDSCRNQSITFSALLVNGSDSGDAITVTFTNWINTTTPLATFTSGNNGGQANYSIIAFEYNSSDTNTTSTRNATSNNFTVIIDSATVEPTPTPTSGGGGGGGSSQGTQIISLKIIVPEPVSAKQKDKLIIPLKITNEGEVDLEGITLTSVIAKDGLLRTDLISSFDRSYFDELEIDESEDVTLIVDIDTADTGLFEVTINGTVEDPEYMDWAKMYIEIEEEFNILERIIFTEEFIIGNPTCAEFQDLINEAKDLHAQGRFDEALIKSESALDSCKIAITQPPRPRLYERVGDKFFTYAAIASLAAFGAGFIYYYYRRVRLKVHLGHVQGKL